MRIQHNILAMNAYRNYTNNVSALGKNLERLSSGYKINRAGDDAAGLAISEKMRAQITGLDAASKNVKDGISLVKTAEGAMQEIQDMLNRMDYLATQSANGTYDNDTDRAALQKEVDQLKSEINRIAESANFNGIKLLDGSLDTTVKVAGATDVSVTVLADGQLGQESQAGVYSVDFSNVEVTSSTDGNELTVTVFGETLTVTVNTETLTGEDLAQKFAAAWDATMQTKWKDDYGFTMNAEANGSKLTFTMDKAPTKEWVPTSVDASKLSFKYSTLGDITGNNAEEVQITVVKEAIDSSKGRMYGQASFDLSDIVKDGATLTIGDQTYVFAVGAKSKYKDMENVIDLTDRESDASDLVKLAGQRLSTAAANNSMFKVGSSLKDGIITITEKEGAVDYAVNNLAGSDGKGSKGVKGTLNATANDWAGLVKSGTVDVAHMGTALNLQIGDTSDSYNQMKVKVGDMHARALGIADLDISNAESAAAAIQTIRNAINQVSSVRGDLGATQNRLEHTQNNLSVMAENIQDAESTIRDTDVAEEMMSYVKNNILVQSAQAMLAQANQVPQGVLQLLG